MLEHSCWCWWVCCSPTAAAFFPLVSLWCSCVLFYGALWVLHTAGVELDFFHRAAIIAFWAGAVLYFYWALGRRQFIYAWDYVNYIQKQFNTEAAFALGPVAGFKYIISTFSEDYTNFITLFTEFPFCLTAKTGDSYAFAQVFCVLPQPYADAGWSHDQNRADSGGQE
mgnify:CR=1 FL=1